jgi:glycosyltransferase involved in cell wall biosynthesis
MISVCMATYNGEKFVQEQIESILRQLKNDDQLIISDDSSTDSTIDVIKSIKDKRIILIEHQTFQDYNFNFENALKYAEGDYIFLSDQDDIWKNDKVASTLECFEKTKANVIISDCELVDINLNTIHQSFFRMGRSKKSGIFYNLYKNSYLGCCMAFDRKTLKASLPFPKKLASHDTWIGLMGEFIGTTYFLNESLILFRRHGKNFSATNNVGDIFLTGQSPYSLWHILNNRVYLIFSLFKRFIKLKFLSSTN